VKIYKDLADRAKKDAELAPAAKQIDHTEASAPRRQATRHRQSISPVRLEKAERKRSLSYR